MGSFFSDLGLQPPEGGHTAVRLARPRLLRVDARVRAGTDPGDLTGLRVLLIADLLFRIAELGGMQVVTTRVFAADPAEPARQAAVERAADALGVHPPVLPADSSGMRPGGSARVQIADDGAVGLSGHDGITVRVAPAHLNPDALPGHATADLLGGHDPVAVRLALMSVPHHQPAGLTAASLAAAGETLGRWRRQVAEWAQSPSRAISDGIAAAVQSAFDNLDSVAALDVLETTADDESMPAGARFEAVAYTDRVLGLELPRDIGR